MKGKIKKMKRMRVTLTKFQCKKLEELDPSWMYEQFMIDTPGYEGRGYHYKVLYDVLKEDALNPFLGVGPGMFLSNTGAFFKVPLYNRYNLVNLKWGYRPENITFLVSDVPAIAGEFGFLGLFAFWFILFRIYKNSKEGIETFNDLYLKGVSAGFLGSILMIFISSFGERTLEAVYFQYLLWFFAAIIYKMKLIKKRANPPRG